MSIAMQKVLANTFSMYLRAHRYHWNVEGLNFAEHHRFLGKLYQELHDAVDTTAEQIRALDIYAIGTYAELFAFSDIPGDEESNNPIPALTMMQNLLADNHTIIESIKIAHREAETNNNKGLVNFLEERLDVHAKHGWMLRSFTR